MLKAVIAGSTFLWKKNELNAVQKKIAAHTNKELHTYLTAEDTMQLYKDSLVDSELIYGTVVEVLEEAGGWTKVTVPDQPSSKDKNGYPGFVRSRDLMTVTEKFAKAPVKVAVIAPIAELILKNGRQKLPFGAVLPLIGEEGENYAVGTPKGKALISRKSAQRTDQSKGETVPQRMMELADQFMDLPYIWSGTSGCGFDCSGFVYSLHRTCGIIIPRDTPEQAEDGQHVSYEEAKPGDLLLFAYEEGKGVVHHVGLYLGNDEMIHSQTPGSKVMKTKIAGSKYEPELCVVARYW